MQAHVASDEAKAAYTTYQAKQSAYYTGNYTYANMITQTGNTLFGTINTLMGNTCLNGNSGYSYNALRSEYVNVDKDLNNSGYIIGYYNGQSINGTWDSGATWNREHTWPQSKFKGSNSSGTSLPMGYDMQSVRPASTSVNSGRGNTAYGEGSSYYNPDSESSISNTSYNSRNNGTYRGDCARVILYDYVVYGKWGSYSNSLYKSSVNADLLTQIGSNSNSVFESIAILLKWHMQDPPSLTEMVRNDGGQDYQGNRNVFIDYPELAINMLKDESGVTINTVTYNIGATETASPAYVYTIPEGFVTYISNTSGGHPTTVTVTGATGTYEADMGRLTITNVTGPVTITTISSPTLTVSTNSVSIVTTANVTNSATFTITGISLTSGITISQSGSTGIISVSPTSIAADANGTHTITVTYSPTATGTHTATLTISSGGAESQTVTINGTCSATQTVTWQVSGVTYTTGNPDTQVAAGTQVGKLPTDPECEGKVFVGWSTTSPSGTNTAPADLFNDAAHSPIINNNTTFNAIFATATSSGGTVLTNNYAKITSTDDLTTGNYIVVGYYNFNYYAMKNEVYNDYYIAQQAVTPSSDIITTTDGGIIWNIAVSGSSLSFYNASSNYVYMYCPDGSHYNLGFTDDTSLGINFTYSVTSGSWDFISTAFSGRHLEYYGSKSDFSVYTSAGDPIYLYKQQSEPAPTTYSDYTATCGSIDPCTKLSTPTVTAAPGDEQIILTWPVVEDAVRYNVTISNGDGYTTECLTDASIGEIIIANGTCTCVITSLTNGLEYTTSVIAVSSNTSCNSDADEDTATPTAACTVTITANPNSEDYGSTSVTDTTP